MIEFTDPYDGIETRPYPNSFSNYNLLMINAIIRDGVKTIVDPMAGTGSITGIGDQYNYICNELEPEWASQIDPKHTVTIGDPRDVKLPDGDDYVVVMRPPNGDRRADVFHSKTRPEGMKGRFAGDLGRNLTEGSIAAQPFNSVYMDRMDELFPLLFGQMNKDCRFILSVGNFTRGNDEINVTGYYLNLFSKHNFVLETLIPILVQDDTVESLMVWRKL